MSVYATTTKQTCTTARISCSQKLGRYSRSAPAHVCPAFSRALAIIARSRSIAARRRSSRSIIMATTPRHAPAMERGVRTHHEEVTKQVPVVS